MMMLWFEYINILEFLFLFVIGKFNVAHFFFPGQEVYYIKKQDQLLQETQNVIPDTQKRLNAAYHDLKTLVETEVT